jgi:hypothetical protein
MREPGINMVRHYLDPDPYDVTAPALIRLDPIDADNGVGALRQQFLAYRGKESTKFTGEGGVVKKDDDLVDPMRYLCMHRVSYTEDGACGNETRIQPDADQPPIEAPVAPVLATVEPYKRHLAMSRSRRRAGDDTWVEIDV